MTGERISKQIAIAGGQPATFRLSWKAPGSFDLYCGNRKLGTAHVEKNGGWTARFNSDRRSWMATADSSGELLRLIGVFVLAQEAKQAPPAEEELGQKKSLAPERKFSAEWKELQKKRRLMGLDALIREARKRISPVQ